MTFAHADTDHASHHDGAAIVDCGGQCPAALNIRGQRFNCEWPVDPEKGVHEGWSHSSKAARAVWVDDRGLNACTAACSAQPSSSAPSPVASLATDYLFDARIRRVGLRRPGRRTQ